MHVRNFAGVVVGCVALGTSSLACEDEKSGPDGGGGAAGSGQGGSDSTPRDVTIHFRAQVVDEEGACGQTYASQGTADTEVTPRDLRFYVSDVRLVTAEVWEVQFVLDERPQFQAEGVALLAFEDGSAECSNGNDALNGVITGKIAAGNYKGIVFSTAVPEELNHEDPTTLPDPLQAGGMTWGWLLGYKFLVAELAATSGEGTGIFHLGSTGCENTAPAEGGAGGTGPDYGAPPEMSCRFQNRNEIRLEEFDFEADDIVLDLSAVFSEIDLSGMAMCHSMGDGCASLFPSLGVELTTGEASATQRAFRVEAR